MPKNSPVMCPSAMCEPGNHLLGVVNHEGHVSILPQPIAVTEAFVSIARQGRSPEKRFRFSAPCISKGCAQWKNGRCGIGDEVVNALGKDGEEQNPLPSCSIRDACRWFLQSGASACYVCPEVITNTCI